MTNEEAQHVLLARTIELVRQKWQPRHSSFCVIDCMERSFDKAKLGYTWIALAVPLLDRIRAVVGPIVKWNDAQTNSADILRVLEAL